jgi:hypothetical protein
MTLLNKFFIDSFTYFNKKGLSISDALKVTDIFLLQLDIDTNDEAAFNSYMDDFIELNKLLANYFDLSDNEASELLDNKRYELCKTLKKTKDKAAAILKIKSRRLALYEKYTPALVKLVADFKSEVNIKAA